MLKRKDQNFAYSCILVMEAIKNENEMQKTYGIFHMLGGGGCPAGSISIFKHI